MSTRTVFSVRKNHCLVLWMALTILVSLLAPAVGMAQQSPATQALQHLTMTVLFDHNPGKEGLEARNGFSCLIQGLERTILFDTGGEGVILLSNMQKLGFDPHDIDVVMLSHHHSDHVEGLPDVLKVNPNVTVYLLNSFLPGFKDKVKSYGTDVIEIQDSLKICDHAYSSGELGEWIKEQALILQTDKGVIVITGCAHPGIVSIVQNAKELLHDDVLLVMGGFHLSSESRTTVEQIVSDFQQLGVRYVGPCHCSGDTARQLFKEAYHSNFIPVASAQPSHWRICPEQAFWKKRGIETGTDVRGFVPVSKMKLREWYLSKNCRRSNSCLFLIPGVSREFIRAYARPA
ncbi:hypothetical protein U27_02880 [Candidatus Vecturithrix granuli]|uniref:Rhodanese domain-containing protein n=1 Tax=Vecturithrix granuli TaxID=1499967 RepID=A0A081BUB4_VECG1|nr:hypothetical protein U27_02880 [Candidatus Vecturithrix granuli]